MSVPRPNPSGTGERVAAVNGGHDGHRRFLAADESSGVNPFVTQSPGQAFTDLLLLGALAGQAPVALLSVPQPDGTWSTLTYGLDTKEGANDGQLFMALAASDEPVELVDLVTRLPRSPLVLPPHSMRWAYGVALRHDSGAVIGVVVMLDRRLRETSKREQRALAALARQLSVLLLQWKRPTTDAHALLPTALPESRPGSGPLCAVGHVGGTGPDRAQRGAMGVGGSPLDDLLAAGEGGSVTGRHNLLRSQEVAEVFDVTERTVINWAAAGKLPSLRTIGGHLRFRREDVLRLLAPPASPPGR